MQPFTTLTTMLLIEAGSLAAILVALLTSSFLALTWHLLNKARTNYKQNADEIKLGNAIHAFNDFCGVHYRHAAQLFRHYTLKKGNEFDADQMLSNSLDTVKAVSPAAFFREYASLLSCRQAPRITLALVEIVTGLKAVTESMNEIWQRAGKDYEIAVKEYHENIYDLSRICNELREYVNGRTLNKTADEWVHAFIAIFDQWFLNGANKDIATLQSEIVLKIVELNKAEHGATFSNRTNEKALKCQLAFDRITQLDDVLCNKIAHYIRTYKKAMKVSGVIGNALAPVNYSPMIFHASPVPAHATSYGLKQKVTFGSGLLLIAAVCFCGGLYSGKTPRHADIHKVIPDSTAHKKHDTSKAKVNTDTVAIKPKDTVSANKFAWLDSVATVSGIDISRYQGNLLRDMSQLDTLHFVICKATQGASRVDPEFRYNWARLKDLNVIRGAYHFYTSSHDPAEQAKHFLNTVGSLAEMDLPLILDIEDQSIQYVDSTGSLQPRLLEFLKHVEARTGRKPIIYTSLAFANSYLRDTVFGRYPLWLAEYSKKRNPIVPVTWKRHGHTFWQKTDSFRFDSRKVDFDVFNGNGAAFAKFIRQ